MTDLDTDPRALALRDAYTRQLRGRMIVRRPDVETVTQVGPVYRQVNPDGRGFIDYPDLGDLAGERLDAFIAGQRDHFTRLGLVLEWKYHGYDLPADLPDRLRAAGFAPEDAEVIVIGEAAEHVIADRLPAEVRLRELDSSDDLERVRQLQSWVWGGDFAWLPGALAAERASRTDPVVVLGAEVGDALVCAAWIRFHLGTEFTSLWGGSTLPDWRGRGLYRALVARRAQLALARGFTYLQFDCSLDSRVILRRMGMSWVATTIPYVWTPPPTS